MCGAQRLARRSNDMEREPRQLVNRPAAIVLGKNRRFPCRIANVSRTGALVLISHSESIPKTFELEDTFSGITRRATVVWKGAKGIGVRFESGSELAPQRHATHFGRRKV